MKNSYSNEDKEPWDLVIKNQSSVFQVDLANIWKYRDLLALLVRRDFVSFYKQTILGPLWFFLQPLFTTITFVIIFGNLAGISTDGLPKPLFYLTGVIAWNYFADCLTKTSTVFKDNAGIFGKVYFPRLIMPVSIVTSNLVKFLVQFLMLVIVIVYFVLSKNYVIEINWYLLLLPYYIILMASLGLGLGMIISAMTTKYRDLSFLVSFGVQLLMYATPVIYPISAAPSEYRQLILLNPMSPILEGIRFGILGKGQFSFASLGYTTLVTVLILSLGIIVFNKVEKNFVDTI